MAEVLWRAKMRKRAEIRAVYNGTYKQPGMTACIGAFVTTRKLEKEEECV